jgi:hypothetical protein
METTEEFKSNNYTKIIFVQDQKQNGKSVSCNIIKLNKQQGLKASTGCCV